MRRLDPSLREQSTVRRALRFGGPVVLGIGLLLTAVALIDFFASFGSFGMPTKFWLGFIGLPMVAVGFWMTQAGYIGPATRYVAGEVAPTIRDAVGALGFGSQAACPSCGAGNDVGASFCSSCGKAMAATCAACGGKNDVGAAFCNRCGKPLAAS